MHPRARRHRGRQAATSCLGTELRVPSDMGQELVSVVGGVIPAGQMAVQGVCSELLQSSGRAKANLEMIGVCGTRGGFFRDSRACLCAPGRV